MGTASAARHGPFRPLLTFAVVSLLGSVAGWPNALIGTSHHLYWILPFDLPLQTDAINRRSFFVAFVIRVVSWSWRCVVFLGLLELNLTSNVPVVLVLSLDY